MENTHYPVKISKAFLFKSLSYVRNYTMKTSKSDYALSSGRGIHREQMSTVAHIIIHMTNSN